MLCIKIIHSVLVINLSSRLYKPFYVMFGKINLVSFKVHLSTICVNKKKYKKKSTQSTKRGNLNKEITVFIYLLNRWLRYLHGAIRLGSNYTGMLKDV